MWAIKKKKARYNRYTEQIELQYMKECSKVRKRESEKNKIYEVRREQEMYIPMNLFYL